MVAPTVTDGVALGVATTSRRRRCAFPAVLEQWLHQRGGNLYPSRLEKDRLAAEHHMTYEQVNRWFANRRRKRTKDHSTAAANRAETDTPKSVDMTDLTTKSVSHLVDDILSAVRHTPAAEPDAGKPLAPDANNNNGCDAPPPPPKQWATPLKMDEGFATADALATPPALGPLPLFPALGHVGLLASPLWQQQLALLNLYQHYSLAQYWPAPLVGADAQLSPRDVCSPQSLYGGCGLPTGADLPLFSLDSYNLTEKESIAVSVLAEFALQQQKLC